MRFSILPEDNGSEEEDCTKINKTQIGYYRNQAVRIIQRQFSHVLCLNKTEDPPSKETYISYNEKE